MFFRRVFGNEQNQLDAIAIIKVWSDNIWNLKIQFRIL